MIKLKKPGCIPSTREGLREWNKNFVKNAPPLASKYKIPKERVDGMKTNADILETAYSIQDKVRAYDRAITNYIESILNFNPTNPVGTLEFPAFEEFTVPSPAPAIILSEASRMVYDISTSPERTDADLKLLQIIPETAPPTEVIPVEKIVKPRLKAFVKNGKVTVKITKGIGLSKVISQVNVDREGKGEYLAVGVTNNGEFVESATLPDGVQTAAWTYRVLFLNGQAQVGEYAFVSVVLNVANVAAKAEVAPSGSNGAAPASGS